MAVHAGERLERVRASSQYRDGKFHNPTRGIPVVRSNSWALTREFFFGGKRRIPRTPLPVENPLEGCSRSPRRARREF